MSARFPQQLAQQIPLTCLRDGVHEVNLGKTIRVIVANHLPQEEHNAMLLLFSAKMDLLRYGQQHYRPHSKETSTLLLALTTEGRLAKFPLRSRRSTTSRLGMRRNDCFIKATSPVPPNCFMMWGGASN